MGRKSREKRERREKKAFEEKQEGRSHSPQKTKHPQEKKSFFTYMKQFCLFVMKTAYYLLLALLMLTIISYGFGLLHVYITGEFDGTEENLGPMLFLCGVVAVLFFIWKKPAINVLTFFLFMNSFGLPSGWAFMGMFFMLIIGGFAQRFFGLAFDDWFILYLLIGFFVSWFVFPRFAKWFLKVTNQDE